MTSCAEGSVTVTCDANNSSLKLVEMCSEGVWSPVCDHDWTLQDATVFCKELGFSSLGIIIVHAYYITDVVLLIQER